MNVTYIQHSGFSVDFADMMLVFDYWMGEITIPEDKPVYVFVSHAHHDHFNEEIFEWERSGVDIRYILSDDINADPAENRILLGPDEFCDLGNIKIKTLRSTDEGVAFFVSIQTSESAQEVHIYHAGDLNWWHWEEEGREYNQQMKEDYQNALRLMEGEHVDVAFVPVDPRLEDAYYWGIDWYMRHTDTERVYPMHMWGQYEIQDRLLCQPETAPYRERIVKVMAS